MNTSVKNLRVNPAQMRSRIGAATLGRLSEQIGHGFCSPLRILVRQEGERMVVISGHSRWLASMIAALSQAKDGDCQAVVEEHCQPDEEGWIALTSDLYERLIDLVDHDISVPVEIWEGSEDAEILVLLKANLGGQEPNLAGMANAFVAGIDRGISLQEMAQATGLTEPAVKAILDILLLPPTLQKLLDDGRLDLDMASDLAALDTSSLAALAAAAKQVIEGEELYMDNYTSRMKTALVNLRYKPSVPKASGHLEPEAVNTRRVFRQLWTKAMTETPDELKTELVKAGLFGRDVSSRHGSDVLAAVSSTKGYLQTRGYYKTVPSDEGIQLLTGISCGDCVFDGLPKSRLKEELDLPCRRASFRGDRCLHWSAQGKPFYMRTPFSWHKSRVVQSLDALATEWTAQHDYEAAQGLTGKGPKIQQQRAEIQTYMDRHDKAPFDTDHPWAAACARCHHHLDKSPVKSDPDAPWCSWAKGIKTIHFDAYWPREGEPDLVIPACRQFAPGAPWKDIIPEADTPAPFDEKVMEKMILSLATSTNNNTYSTSSRGALQFLSGRPPKATDNHRVSFARALRREQASLTKSQLWTILQWMMLDWARAHVLRPEGFVPVAGGTQDFRLIPFSSAMVLLDRKEK